jgi:hypothetical protein
MARLSSIVCFVALPLLAQIGSVSASPLIHDEEQSPFGLSEPFSKAAQSSAPKYPSASLEAEIKLLLNIIEDLAEEATDDVFGFTGGLMRDWTYSKESHPRSDWDITVSSEALPDHALRVRSPEDLGIDDVKQVLANCGNCSFSTLVIWM